jgi:hypothetical protein
MSVALAAQMMGRALGTMKSPDVWLWGPRTDLLWIAGGASLLFGALAVPALVAWPSGTAWLLLLLVQLGMLCNFPHYAATYETVYRERAKNPPAWRTLLVSLVPAVAFLGIAGMYVETALPLTFRLYVAWSAYHYAAQNFGIASMYSARASAPLTSFEKQALKLAFVAVGLPAALRGATTGLAPVLDELGRYWLGVGLLALSLGAFGTLVLRRRREGRAFPLPVVVIFGSQVVWELLPSLRFVSHASWVGAVDTLWPAAIPFFHCAQYLGVVGWRARGVGAGQAVRPLFWYAGLVVGGLLLFRGTALLQGLAFDRPAMQLNLVVAVVNIHHFVIDGMIWRKRMPAPSARTALAAPPSIAAAATAHSLPETA